MIFKEHLGTVEQFTIMKISKCGWLKRTVLNLVNSKILVAGEGNRSEGSQIAREIKAKEI